MIQSETKLIEIKGIGEKTAEAFSRLHLETVSDLIFFFPRSYERFEKPLSIRESKHRDFAAVQGTLVQAPVTRFVKRLKITTATIRDELGDLLELSWFNMPYLSKTLHAGTSYIFRGRITSFGARRKMQQPQVIKAEDYGRLEKTLQPVYNLTKGLTKKTISDTVKKIFDEGYKVPEVLSDELRADYQLMERNQALFEIHFPKTRESFLPARRRIVFEEFYRFILDVRSMKAEVSKEPNHYHILHKEEVDRLISKLPYELTGAQKNTLKEVEKDLTGPSVMNRLIQGDVGSGKTIVAFLAMYETALSGYQSALMAPTEVLAIQHYENFKKMSEEYDLGLSISLLTGSLTAKEKREVYEKIATHQTDIVVGTQALIQEKASYTDLALVVTDEQHRFGVNQRKILSEKGRSVHVLAMSATPIPRTLGMILYGDMDISVMNELPKNRKKIKNALVDIDYRKKAYAFIQNEVLSGHQAYIICPMISESEGSEGENVLDYAAALKSYFPPDITVSVLHGKMKNEEKEKIMAEFSENRIQVLISTTVIEVGIDVKNATVMMIENAERFGLAQLHQLRGRVGRGDDQSYCIFVDTTMSEDSQKRLAVLRDSNDGFYIAEEDLKMRGPGDFFGVRQSGDLAFQLADIYTDADILKLAEEAVSKTSDVNVKSRKVVL